MASASSTQPEIFGYHVKVDDVRALLASLPKETQVMRADRVYGEDHLRLAARLASRAFAEGRARSADLATETLLYAAGERQVGKALAFLGISAQTRAIAVVSWAPEELRALALREGWREDPALLAGGEGVLDAYGVTNVERSMLPEDRRGDIILERVALTDVLKA